MTLYRNFGKRVIDAVAGVLGLVLLSPVIACVALVVHFSFGGKVLFRQARGGLHGIPFQIIKFTTMTQARRPDGSLLPDADRLTPTGRLLRKLSLDELPELLNVIKGDMSLVGPRPFIYDYMPHYSPLQMERHQVRPGITGWAQISGRNAISWEERIELDRWYVKNLGFFLDLKIFLLTIVQVFRPHGIAAAGSETMPRFDRREV